MKKLKILRPSGCFKMPNREKKGLNVDRNNKVGYKLFLKLSSAC